MYILSSSFIYALTIDKNDINLKFPDIKQEFKSQFPEIQISDNIIFLKNNAIVYVIAEDQITYSVQGDTESIDLEQNYDTIKKIMSILNLNDDFLNVLRFELLDQSTFTDKMSASKELLTDLPEDIEGVGLRFFIKNKDYRGELKVEPYVKDPEKFYLTIEFEALQKSNNLETLKLLLKDSLKKANYITNKYYKK